MNKDLQILYLKMLGQIDWAPIVEKIVGNYVFWHTKIGPRFVKDEIINKSYFKELLLK